MNVSDAPQDRQGAWPRYSIEFTRHRRRGDRVTEQAIILDCCVALAAEPISWRMTFERGQPVIRYHVMHWLLGPLSVCAFPLDLAGTKVSGARKDTSKAR